LLLQRTRFVRFADGTPGIKAAGLPRLVSCAYQSRASVRASEVHRVREIGRGGFGVVDLVRYRNQHLAQKALSANAEDHARAAQVRLLLARDWLTD
jgi:hypothetical protein